MIKCIIVVTDAQIDHCWAYKSNSNMFSYIQILNLFSIFQKVKQKKLDIIYTKPAIFIKLVQ